MPFFDETENTHETLEARDKLDDFWKLCANKKETNEDNRFFECKFFINYEFSFNKCQNGN